MRSEALVALANGDQVKFREEKQEHLNKWRAFLKRPALGDKEAPKPKRRKLYRKKAFEHLVATENIALQVYGKSIKDYCYQPEDAPKDAMDWPRLWLNLDRGSDGIAATNFLLRRLNCNIVANSDISHDANNDIIATLKDCQLWPLFLCLCASWNMPHGPWAEQARFHQIKEALGEQKRLCDTPGDLWGGRGSGPAS